MALSWHYHGVVVMYNLGGAKVVEYRRFFARRA